MKGWFIPGKSPIAACDVHRRVWIDNATGLRLSGAPEDPATAHAEVCEFWPSDLERLFQAAGLPRVGPPAVIKPSGASMMASGGEGGQRALHRFAEEGADLSCPRGRGRMTKCSNLEATAETSREQLHWFVDAAYLGVSEPSSALLWKLQPGRHVIRAVDDAGRADSREIVVTAVE